MKVVVKMMDDFSGDTYKTLTLAVMSAVPDAGALPVEITSAFPEPDSSSKKAVYSIELPEELLPEQLTSILEALFSHPDVEYASHPPQR